MRPEEKFVAEALVEFFGGSPNASAFEGENPPDLYLRIGDSCVAVEVAQLFPITIEPNGTVGNRTTQDSHWEAFLDKLDRLIGPLLPDNISLLVSFSVPIEERIHHFKNSLTKLIREVALESEKRFREQRVIEGSKIVVSIIPRRPSGKKIVGRVVNKNSSTDISLNARLILENRIREKSIICTSLPKPIWLALLNHYSYASYADANIYINAYRQLKISHCFERIFLVSDEGVVCKLTGRDTAF